MSTEQGLRASDLAIRFGERPILRGISARFDKGQVIAIVGPNGAGKSTLLACLAGLLKPDAGAAVLDGTPVAALPGRARARRIAFLAQTPEIAWDVDIRAFVGLGRTPHLGAFGPSDGDRAAIDAAIAAAGLEAFVDRPITRMSGGERARALIARALAGETDWLLADEPLTGLDPGHALDALALFRRMAHDQGKGVIVTLHDLNLAARFADRVLVLSDGALAIDAAPEIALAPEILSDVYGVLIRRHTGEIGPLIEVLGRVS
ncbi:ABC transporter ATP-binding protein [Caulobacter segnis]|jgi:iron complex transport system ATP-binding protein|uniref:ABC transporter ATP-binding protein n=1 Tax=Caulobacter segnis TaxID=88688 RepID=UPI001CBBCE32|nr:ABC transporter ATP-binding protein [Caulobacter segnis]UAL12802.1 ABC transporter ATP-binding protein [Caulobacter segnis]